MGDEGVELVDGAVDRPCGLTQAQDELRRGDKGVVAQPALAHPAALGGRHQSRVLEHAEVLHHAEPRHLQIGLELRQRASVAHEEPVEEMPPRRVGEGLEHAVVVSHGRQYR